MNNHTVAFACKLLEQASLGSTHSFCLLNSLVLLPIVTTGLVWFVLFNGTWSQYGHSVSCMAILFQNSQNTRSDIRPHIKWAVSLVIACGHFILPQGFVWMLYELTYSLYHPRGLCSNRPEMSKVIHYLATRSDIRHQISWKC